jgi:sporulation protein YlmC with PRC-barrel domain
MRARCWAGGLVAAALAGCPVLVGAQDHPAATPPQSVAPPTPEAGPQDIGAPGVWRLSDLLRQDVYRPNAVDLGTVDDIIMNRDGRIEAIVVAMRNRLGFPTRRVALPLTAVQIVPAKATATSGTVGGLKPSTEAGATTRSYLMVSDVLTPAGIVLRIPENELQSAPAFQGGRAAQPATPAASPPEAPRP